MHERRPDWCKNVNCPNRPGYDRCYLHDWVIKNFTSYLVRMREYERIRELVKVDPQEVREYCREKLQEI